MDRAVLFLFTALLLLLLLPSSFAKNNTNYRFGYPRFKLVASRDQNAPAPNDPEPEVAGIMVTLSESGINYVKEVLVNEILAEITPLALPDINAHVDSPIGRLDTKISQILLSGANVSYSDVDLGKTGITVFAGDVEARIRLHWYYEYSASYVPWPVNDGGWADVEVGA